MAKKKRPLVDWLRWSRKIFFYTIYGLGALLFFILEKLESLLGGKVGPKQPVPLTKNLNVTISAEANSTDLILPFVQLFSSDARWIKLKSERVFKDLRQEQRSLVFTSRLQRKGIPEGSYRADEIAVLTSQKEMAVFLEELVASGVSLKIERLLSTRRTGSIPHAKGLLIRMAVGNSKLGLFSPKGGARLVQAGVRGLAEMLRKGFEYQHLLIAASTGGWEKLLSAVESRGNDKTQLSAYACLNIAERGLLPVFLVEPMGEKTQLEDAALLLANFGSGSLSG